LVFKGCLLAQCLLQHLPSLLLLSTHLQVGLQLDDLLSECFKLIIL
jgi:hypothetical protein